MTRKEAQTGRALISAFRIALADARGTTEDGADAYVSNLLYVLGIGDGHIDDFLDALKREASDGD